MCEKKPVLSASNIRYLIALNALDNGCGIRCIDIAAELCFTKPSIHRMMETLCRMALVKKAKYGTVSLTEEGRKLASRYASHYETICGFLAHKFSIPPESSKNAALALLAAISGEYAEIMCEIMRGA